MEATVSRVHGVDEIRIDLSTGRVDVLLTHAHDDTDELLRQAVVDSGFTLERLEQ